MSRLRNAAILGCVVGLVGMAASLLDRGRGIEAAAGLELLFALRGTARPPSDVVIVSADEESAERLHVPDRPDKWPRSLHARLVEALSKRGARAIVFDLYFTDAGTATDDQTFAEAMARARNVVLAAPLQLTEVPSSDEGRTAMEEHRVVKLVEPIAPLSQAAVAVAPFVLPGMPVQVHRYWTFQPSAGDRPTFPAVALQLYALPLYDDFLRLLRQTSPVAAGKLPRDAATTVAARGLVGLVRGTREMFLSDPAMSAKLRDALEHSPGGRTNEHDRRVLKSLVEMYGGLGYRYLNYYGPPRTIPTVSFERVLRDPAGSAADEPLDFANKAVFVGRSRLSTTDREDRYYTVFSRTSGQFISGVEIAATAFANLLDDVGVKPIDPPQDVLIIVLWGGFLGALCHMAGAVAGALAVAGVMLAYLGAAELAFRSSATWYPVVVPLAVQAPLAWLGAVLWRYVETSRERQNIRNALAYYVPDEVVQVLTKNRIDMKRGGQTLYGVCLFSDVAGYTSVSETMGPQELSEFMHRYFEAVFEPIKEHGGLVIAVEGDAMLAIWKSPRPEPALRQQACQAALGVVRAVRRFNASLETVKLPTRIGVHAGQVFLGNIGAGGHYAYSAAGDTVNTASRLEGLNKHLGTATLVSDDTIRDLDGFLTREAGTFRLKGKTHPIVVHELLCRLEESGLEQRRACGLFAEGLRAFRSGAWDEARALFSQVSSSSGGDGLSTFYMRLCEEQRHRPPGDAWEGIIELAEK